MSLFAKAIERLKLRLLERRLLKAQGFVTYCRACRFVLNDQSAETVNEARGLYAWTCGNCRSRSTFDLFFPAPVLVDFVIERPTHGR